MSNVLVRNTQARVFIFNGRSKSGIVRSIHITPSVNANEYQEVPTEDWDLIKSHPTVLHCINEGHLVVKNAEQIASNETIKATLIESKPIAGDSLVKGKEAVESEIEKMLKDGDIDGIADKYPALAKAMQDKVSEPIDSDSDSGDDDNADDSLSLNIDELLESLDGKDADEIKKALRKYGKDKYDKSFGNSGVDKMISVIREIESEVDGD